MHDTDGGTHAEDSNKAQHDANQVEIRIPRAVLCSSSKFFQSATKDEWALLRDKKQTITVAFESGLFQAYVHWLYFGTIPRLTNSSSTTPPKDSPYLAKLYVLGEEIMDFRFKNAIMDNFIAVYSGRKIFPSVEAVAIIYGATVGGSPMRRMLAEIYAYRARGSKDWKCLPKEALLDIVELMAEVRLCVKGNKPWLNVGDYHEKEKD
ncbi:hypothetical protein P171DRAFT_389114 [Karstenula rhodostoma CBS 690.94]|uniref:BTB domain-containing protein n=1 Tax=Karstenula rhodostoma CBS 690.94 TaxID=1392251 RepID=A0A9P4PI71_9PLEO|nr:hypothetical protein P171DRAFT_389114 [Karstenula rhodostoma CBS 690.94]